MYHPPASFQPIQQDYQQDHYFYDDPYAPSAGIMSYQEPVMQHNIQVHLLELSPGIVAGTLNGILFFFYPQLSPPSDYMTQAVVYTPPQRQNPSNAASQPIPTVTGYRKNVQRPVLPTNNAAVKEVTPMVIWKLHFPNPMVTVSDLLSILKILHLESFAGGQLQSLAGLQNIDQQPTPSGNAGGYCGEFFRYLSLGMLAVLETPNFWIGSIGMALSVWHRNCLAVAGLWRRHASSRQVWLKLYLWSDTVLWLLWRSSTCENWMVSYSVESNVEANARHWNLKKWFLGCTCELLFYVQFMFWAIKSWLSS